MEGGRKVEKREKGKGGGDLAKGSTHTLLHSDEFKFSSSLISTATIIHRSINAEAIPLDCEL